MVEPDLQDFFTDPELMRDPTPYYAALRERGPVVREPHQGVYMVSGIEEVLAIYADHRSFSAAVAPLGPFVELPQPRPRNAWSRGSRFATWSVRAIRCSTSTRQSR